MAINSTMSMRYEALGNLTIRALASYTLLCQGSYAILPARYVFMSKINAKARPLLVHLWDGAAFRAAR
jgi:hypothetical protein